MAPKQVSRSAFATPGQPSLADLIARVEAASDLPKTTRQNWCWALRVNRHWKGTPNRRPKGTPVLGLSR
jgi:hypothetical protein